MKMSKNHSIKTQKHSKTPQKPQINTQNPSKNPPKPLKNALSALPENDFSALFAIASHEITPEYPENISKNCADFLERCLQRDPELRATAAELEKMPFVTGS
jgi:serine/threonine protein kinase